MASTRVAFTSVRFRRVKATCGSGGNLAWWGAETNNWQSAMGVPVVNPGFNTHSMEWRESDNNSFHAFTASTCAASGNFPWYYGCAMANSNTTLEAWTDAH